MVNIACLISNGCDIMINTTEQDSYLLPECSAESTQVAREIITDRLGNEGVLFDFDEILYETDGNGLCHQILYLCHAYQWTNQAEENSYRWIEVRELASKPFSSAYKELANAANGYLARREKLISKIKSEIEKIHDQSQVKIVIGEQVDKTIFWLRHSKIYVPFCLEIDYLLNGEDTVDFRIRWRASRQYAPGDKSDLYMLFSETMALLLKLFDEPVFVSTYNYLGLEPEINGAEIIFEGNNYSGTIAESDFADKIIDSFEFFNFILGVHGRIFGTISNDLIKGEDKSIIDYLGGDSNYIIRKESSCYYNSSIGYISLRNNYFDYNNLTQLYSYELLTGVNGTLLFSSFSDQTLFTNYIAKEILDKVNEVINHFTINQYTLVCQSNRLYLLSSNYIWIFAGDYHHSNVAKEERLILDRQAKENALLHVNREFKWIFPVNPARFEQLIADIIEYKQPDSIVRLVGKTNNPDGGRDIIIRKNQGEARMLTICQCKAYQGSVNKTHVTDIRDMLDYYEASGFLLAVTSDVTAPLIDYLMSLSKKYKVDWWTKREIFKTLRQYPSLVDAYQDIVSVIDNQKVE